MPAQPGPRYRALLEVLRAAETIWNASRVFFAQWNLSPSQFNVLNLLHDQAAGLSQSELSRQLIMHRSNVTGLVDRLERRGLVRRRDSATDRRAWRITLSSEGQKLVRQILPLYYQSAEEVWGGISADRAARIVTGLSRLSVQAVRLAERFG